MKILIVDDDFASRLLLQAVLSRYGECHIAVNGREAVAAFRAAARENAGYDLICLDIMMPDVDGSTALKEIRALEEAQGVSSSSGVKIIMTTALDDMKTMAGSFHELCDAYVTKPVNTAQLLGHVRSFKLIP
jgi:two-component system, chemotaxis family, chemotaxis protein CheY